MTQPENQAEALDEKALAAAYKEMNDPSVVVRSQKSVLQSCISAYLASLPEAPAVPVGGEEARKIVNDWYSWIVAAADDMDFPEGMDEEIRRITDQRHALLAALASQNAVEGEAVAWGDSGPIPGQHFGDEFSPRPAAADAGVREALRALQRAEEGAGTLPAKEAVKLRPADWKALGDAVRSLSLAAKREKTR